MNALKERIEEISELIFEVANGNFDYTIDASEENDELDAIITGVNMLAGTIIVLGEVGIRSGAGMKRGSIIYQQKASILPTFSRSCEYQPVFLKHYFKYLKSLGLPISDALLNGAFERWCGDSVELNRGEILIYAGK